MAKCKITQKQYLEIALWKELQMLKTDKDILKFFKSIRFVDEGNIYYNLYNNMVNIITSGDKPQIKKKGKIGWYTLYVSYLNLPYEERRDFKETMKNSFNSWLQKYHSNYKEYFVNGMSRNNFIKLLVEYTGYKL